MDLVHYKVQNAFSAWGVQHEVGTVVDHEAWPEAVRGETLANRLASGDLVLSSIAPSDDEER